MSEVFVNSSVRKTVKHNNKMVERSRTVAYWKGYNATKTTENPYPAVSPEGCDFAAGQSTAEKDRDSN